MLWVKRLASSRVVVGPVREFFECSKVLPNMYAVFFPFEQDCWGKFSASKSSKVTRVQVGRVVV